MAQKQLQTLNYKLRPLACHIRLDHPPPPGTDVTPTFLRKQGGSPFLKSTFRLCPGLTSIWPYGRVYQTDTGFHGEFFEPNEMILSLIYLGNDDLDAMYMMKRITEQQLYIMSLKDLY